MNHMIAIHERCGNSVEFIPSKQWYIDVLTEKERFLKAADEINWYLEAVCDLHAICYRIYLSGLLQEI